MSLDDSLRSATVLDRNGYPYIIHPLLDGVPACDPALLREWVAWARTREGLDGADALLAPEAMAMPLATALSIDTGIPYLVARKRSYGLPGEAVCHCETGYGTSRLHINGLAAGAKVVLVDDVISTGGTLGGLLRTLAAMDVETVRVLALVDKGDQAQALAARHDVPIDVMRRVRVTDGSVEASPGDRL